MRGVTAGIYALTRKSGRKYTGLPKAVIALAAEWMLSTAALNIPMRKQPLTSLAKRGLKMRQTGNVKTQTKAVSAQTTAASAQTKPENVWRIWYNQRRPRQNTLQQDLASHQQE
jgi:hypothetical protein